MRSNTASDGWFQIDGYTNPERRIFGMDVRYGADRVAEVRQYARERDLRRVMLVAGSNLSRNQAIMDPIREALGDLVVGDFFGASPAKPVSAVYAGIDRMKDLEADLIIGIGGGGSLDTARQISAFDADGRSMEQVQESVATGGSIRLEGSGSASVILLPTTLAGADLSVGGSIEVLSASESPSGRPVRTNPPNVAPIAVFYDPRLYETTPAAVLAGSAMNGLDKGIETLYSPRASDPYSTALSSHGLGLMGRGLLELQQNRADGLAAAVAGLILVQLRVSISVIHAFGHAVARNSTIQQGIAHAILAPHVLSFLLDRGAIDPSRLVESLRSSGVLARTGVTDDVVAAVKAIRDSLGLPSRFSELESSDGLDLGVCADATAGSGLLENSPLHEGLSFDDARAILESAW